MKLISLSNLSRFKDWLNIAIEQISELLNQKIDDVKVDGVSIVVDNEAVIDTYESESIELAAITNSEIDALFE